MVGMGRACSHWCRWHVASESGIYASTHTHSLVHSAVNPQHAHSIAAHLNTTVSLRTKLQAEGGKAWLKKSACSSGMVQQQQQKQQQ